MRWLDKPIFVTGATGFIGGRVCERLVQAGASEVRALVHTIKRSPRVARLPISLHIANLLDPQSLRLALGEAKIVIHCGLGAGKGIASGTRNLLEIAKSTGVERFIHISTAAVYGLTPAAGSEVEEAPLRKTGDSYCDNKIRAEHIVNRYSQRGLPVVILRPSIVYGPLSMWSTRLIEDLRHGQVTLIDGGAGACNTTYVDNLVDAIFLSLDGDRGLGETLFITDGERITWGDFILAHLTMLGRTDCLPNLSKEQIRAHYENQPGFWYASLKQCRKVLFSRELRQMLIQIPLFASVLVPIWNSLQSVEETRKERLRTRLLGRTVPFSPQDTLRFPDLATFATQTGTVYFRIDRARKVLGYEPRILFAQGIKAVEQWLRFANYL